MPQSELVSIVIVAYNNWPELDLAIQSALCQSYHPIEVIVVDNSSTDETPSEVGKRFAGRVSYIKQPNTGDAGAYNTGIRLAQGEFIQFLDGDDFLSPYKIEKQMEMFRAEPQTEIVYGDLRFFQGLPRQAHWVDRETRDYEDMLAAILDPEPHGIPTEMSALVRRETLERIGTWDETVYCSDFDYWLRAAWLGCRFRRCPGLLGFVRLHPKQMSADKTAMNRGTEAVLTKALTYIDREPYVTMIRANLAQIQYLRAVRKKGMTWREALTKLHQARETKRDEISLLAYCVGVAAALAPTSYAASSPRFRVLRRFLARLIGYHIPRF